MSGWDAYITTLLDSHPCIRRGAIVGLDSSVWARSEGDNVFRATEAEIKSLLKGFDDSQSLPTTGVDLEGQHYIVPRVEEKLVFGKRTQAGFFAAKTATAVIIAIFEESGGNANCAPQVRGAAERLATYLSSIGY